MLDELDLSTRLFFEIRNLAEKVFLKLITALLEFFNHARKF